MFSVMHLSTLDPAAYDGRFDGKGAATVCPDESETECLMLRPGHAPGEMVEMDRCQISHSSGMFYHLHVCSS